jgi:hypothetical protein
VLEAFWPGVTAANCQKWQTQFNPTAKLLRDDFSIMNALGIKSTYEVVVLDRNLKIVYHNGPYYDSTVKQAVLNQLANLK